MSPKDRVRAGVVCPVLKGGATSLRPKEARLEEAVGLAQAINLDVVLQENVNVSKIKPATFLGEGGVELLADLVLSGEVELVVVDTHLSPVQQRNLERAWKCKVLDRTGLILEIFGQRARTREGVLQVELAALTYQKSRLVRSWTHLERQRGGFGFLGGPGETQLEADRRQIGERIAKLRIELEEVKRTRDLHRKARKRILYPIVALVGYTNAGKSTLFNRLTAADVLVKDQVFATLDPTMRALKLPSGKMVILSDTVGFVSDLPHELVAAFHATLEEVIEAEVLIHVRDISHIDTEAQKESVEDVLKNELGLDDEIGKGMIEVLNKTDRIEQEEREQLLNIWTRDLDKVPLSALDGSGIPLLLQRIEQKLAVNSAEIDTQVSISNGQAISWFYQHGEVLERRDNEEFACFKVRLDSTNLARFKAKEKEWME